MAADEFKAECPECGVVDYRSNLRRCPMCGTTQLIDLAEIKMIS